ncbi:DNA-binding protein [Flavipsychrobacter stenotrophus]|uniref:DNA-binding protein n=1 Tax=Flavipsychrobacter stenotrophus TaxID=2077091 RepID=A0A2S7T1D7_9BACT|nr:helix-turn-helix domain-containing protein [Flavipsychrobacter stenotrophus]PQJ13019.1 DNA-binding protein [Flavipsychrobacter stenotrophus]
MNTNEPQILFPFPADELWEKMRELVRAELQTMNRENKPVEYQTQGFTQKPLFKAHEVCAMLQISRQTLHTWVKEGILKAYKIKSRVFFLWTDIEKLIEKDTQ